MAYGDGAYGQTAYASPTGGIKVYDTEGNIILETSIPNLPEAKLSGTGSIDIEAITKADLTLLKKAVSSTSVAFGHSAEIKRARFGENTVTLELDLRGRLGAHCSIIIEAELTAITEIIKKASGTIQLVAETLLEPTRKIPALSSTALDFDLEGINVRQKRSNSSVEVEVNTSINSVGLLGGKVGITFALTSEITETRIRNAISTIGTTLSVLKQATALRQGFSSTGIGFDIEGINVRQRDSDSSVEIEVNTSINSASLLGGEVGVNLNLTSDITETRIRDAISTVETTFSALETVTALRQRQVSSSTGINFNIEGIDIRQTPGTGSLNITINALSIPTLISPSEANITLELDASTTANRIRGMIGAIEIAQNILAQPTARLTSDSEIDISLNTFADFKVVLSGSSNIQLILESDATGLLSELLFEFSGSLASGDTLEIDGENLLITDPGTGENLRAQFDIEDWPDIGPNGENLLWTDEETGRTIELKIEKEDRTI